MAIATWTSVFCSLLQFSPTFVCGLPLRTANHLSLEVIHCCHAPSSFPISKKIPPEYLRSSAEISLKFNIPPIYIYLRTRRSRDHGPFTPVLRRVTLHSIWNSGEYLYVLCPFPGRVPPAAGGDRAVTGLYGPAGARRRYRQGNPVSYLAVALQTCGAKWNVFHRGYVTGMTLK